MKREDRSTKSNKVKTYSEQKAVEKQPFLAIAQKMHY